MERNERLFIYGRKEIGVLIFLALMIALFAFTLGLHLGKKIETQHRLNEGNPVQSVATTNDKIPNRQELQEQGKGSYQAVDEALNQALHEEVVRTGIKMDQPVQIELPQKTRAKAKTAPATGNTTPTPVPAAGAPDVAPPVAPDTHPAEQPDEKTVPAALRPAPEGRYTLQVGAFQTLDEARDQLSGLEAAGHKPHLRAVEIKDKGKWYRVYLGGYASREEAEKSGTQFKTKGEIESFVVANHVE